MLAEAPAFAPPAISVVVVVSSVTMPDAASIAEADLTARRIWLPSSSPPASKRFIVVVDAYGK
jgi:hypothetical protein